MIVNRQQLADIFGVTPPTIANWSAAGMPTIARGVPGRDSEFDSCDCIGWRIAQVVATAPGAKERERLTRAQAERAELELLERKGKLVPAAHVARVAMATARLVRDGIEMIPDRLASQLAVETDAARVHAILTAELRRVLHSLADSIAAPPAAESEGQE